ncbi:DUF7691 family protein [Actinoplanes sichuanensis]|uniref:DUF7691 domain-containing protein n=1 Tax=Actinoplanes sichuanensis TaxID=512349 RepID=A0ABW4AF40_9ACTN|nr:hypothetical protein [Actinoplanes sichuanensis]
MGYGAQVWAVDLDRLRGEVGSGDRELAQRYGEGFAGRYDSLQDGIDDATGDVGMITPVDVARHMILGEPYDDRLGNPGGARRAHLLVRRE